MVYLSNVVKVMIANPGDVVEQRNIVREKIAEWNAIHSERDGVVLIPHDWQTSTTPAAGSHPQDIINRQMLSTCDVLVGIFAHRVGSGTNKYISGTVEEIETHMAEGKPTLVYFSKGSLPYDLSVLVSGEKNFSDSRSTSSG